MKIKAAALPFALFLSSCATPNPVGKIRNVVITEIHRGGDCFDFIVTAASIRDYFARTVAISGPEHHHLYGVTPCWAEGTFVVGAETWKWEMNGGGAAYVFPPHRERFIVGDPQKQDFGE